ncbi:MAG TPA: DUF1566 domain-containing protein [Candidatus Binatia bacterium]|nr:DUF1566 domain-containing protein [Candidatus Binatia bacterium]
MKRPTRAKWRGALVAAAVMAGLLVGAAAPATAALTTPACLAKKLKEWGNLRKCQTNELAKLLLGKPSDPASCQTKLATKLARLSLIAAATAVPCRYGVNGGSEAGTVTDYDTGLQWELKTDDDSVHDQDNTYAWSATSGPPDGALFVDFLGTLNQGFSADALTTTGCFAEHCDWRLPTIEELRGILDAQYPSCTMTPCTTIPGLTRPGFSDFYWSSSSYVTASDAWSVSFYDGYPEVHGKGTADFVRAVRSAL